MKIENILLAGAVGLAAWFFFFRNRARPMTPEIRQKYFPNMPQQNAVMGAPTCPPGYMLVRGVGGGFCQKMPDAGSGPAQVVLKSGEDMVWDNGRLVPISEIFR